MVSIIVPVLNEAKTIRDLIENIEIQAGENELIIVDGGSVDGTADLVDRRAHLIYSGPGKPQQMNAGASVAKGDILLFLHCDTLLPANAITKIQGKIANSNFIGGGFTHRFAKDGWFTRFISLGANVRGKYFRLFLGDQTIFVRKETFKEVGGYREMPIFEDLDLSTRLRAIGKLALVDEAITTSARRIETWGKGKTLLIWWGLSLLYALGISPDKLARYYRDIR